jgi:hypothetical protein
MPALDALAAGAARQAGGANLTPVALELIDRSIVDQVQILERGLFVAAHFDQPAYVQGFIKRFQQFLQSRLGELAVEERPSSVDPRKQLTLLVSESFRGLRKLGMRDEISDLLDKLAALVRTKTPEPKGKKGPPGAEAGGLQLLLQVAGGWFFFGRDERAWPVLNQVRDVIATGKLPPHRHKPLVCEYLRALGQAPVDQAIRRFEEFFRQAPAVQDTFTTNSHFSLSKLDVVEALVLALVSDDFTLDKQGRRWLDDDEFLVRRRIHRDVRRAMGG